jgi:hypothetical protein
MAATTATTTATTTGDASAATAATAPGDDRAAHADAGTGSATTSSSSTSQTKDDDVADETKGDEEDEETCGFCKYMKGGSCKDAFVAWEACVDKAKETDEDFVEVCYEATSALRDCMLKDPEYYGPMTGESEDENPHAKDEGGDAPSAVASED